ncbi:hypothetical protein AA3271_1446 [Gluconobacter japonicus NBRC 3271]|nr:hypothetical protein AA3271_1446 [Gluconobacter japonicus NBRC 3271]
MMTLPPAGIRVCWVFLVPKSCFLAQILAIQMTAVHAGSTSSHGTDNGMVIGKVTADSTGCAVFDTAAWLGKGWSSG